MQVEIPISLGELLDKLSILKIKKLKIKDAEKLENIKLEESLLEEKLVKLNIETNDFLDELLSVNNKLWDIEDDIREKERNSEFGKEFIELARSVYITNDQRFAIKNQVNNKFGSIIKEVKSYEEY